MSLSQPLSTAPQLGQLLRSARKLKGLTQAQVAERLNLSQSRVSTLELDPSSLSALQLMAWCSIVGLELLVGEKPGAASGDGSVW
ncbi:helix-turn-helix transcriptional regulator [Hydrogenophaga sp.]|uniref:helix-turn-helix domain-containing protein n=1 Tax=Hydrogenophaga sp. TaxID=1904254 RepID=UPI0025BACC9F|nr:helix-turn-helix transcriptional regulator [Hydrogenophaga sp.]